MNRTSGEVELTAAAVLRLHHGITVCGRADLERSIATRKVKTC